MRRVGKTDSSKIGSKSGGPVEVRGSSATRRPGNGVSGGISGVKAGTGESVEGDITYGSDAI